MDWPRAKAILIVAFLLMDALLGVRVWQARTGAAYAPAAAADGAARVREALRREGIVVAGDLPLRTPRALPRLRVRPRGVDADRLGAAFFPAAEGGAEAAGGGVPEARVFVRGGEQLTILPQGLVLYERRDVSAAGVPNALDAAAAARAAADFLRERGLLARDLAADFTLPAPGGRPGRYDVFFVQRYRLPGILSAERPIFTGYVGVEVAGEAVQALEAFLVDVEGPVGGRRRVIGAEDALRALAARLAAAPGGPAGGGGATPATPAEERRLLVERVELGFWGPTAPGAGAWDLSPSWRLLTKDGRVYFVDAYAGRVEESP